MMTKQEFLELYFPDLAETLEEGCVKEKYEALELQRDKIFNHLDSVIAQAIAEYEAKKSVTYSMTNAPKRCDYCGCEPSVIYITEKGTLCKKCNGIG